MKVDAFAGSLPHFSQHIVPIWLSLPSDIRGTFYAKGRAFLKAKELGVETVIQRPPRQSPLCMVASYEDYTRTRTSKVILVNHGIGQTYPNGDGIGHPSYSGGRDRSRVVLNLCPSQRDADNCGPNSVAVGVPYLDPLHRRKKKWTRSDPPVIAVSFHADVHVVPETRWAFPHYQQELIRIAQTGELNLLGHAHPRMENYLHKFWRRLRVPFEPDLLKVIEKADILIADNTSALYEFASVGKPVMVLNAPWYRKDIEHGLRFWSHVPGVQLDFPADFVECVDFALSDPPAMQQQRSEAVSFVYSGLHDGQATERAVAAVMDLVSTHAS